MDTKVTLSFDQEVILKAKDFAEQNNISLSRLTEFLYRRITEKQYGSLEELPISDWVSMVAEGEIEYKKRDRSSSKKEYFESRK
jgi:hypothetical protein